MIRIIGAERLAKLVDGVWSREVAVARLRAELAAEVAARGRAEQDAQYWRTRAELFLDQIGLKSGTISTPTMTPPPAASEPDKLDTVFSSLGKSEINSTSAHAAAPAAVAGVSPQAAAAAIDDLLSSVPRTA